jgi:hypothetical protein
MITFSPTPAAPGPRPASARPAACPHFPRCPEATAPGRDAARTVAAHPEQGWSLLCNGVVVFDDTGELLPGGRALPPRRVRWVPFASAGEPGPGHRARFAQAS